MHVRQRGCELHHPELQVPRLRHLQHFLHSQRAGRPEDRSSQSVDREQLVRHPLDRGQRGRRPSPSHGYSARVVPELPHGYQNVLVRFNSFQRNTGIELDRNTSCRWENVRIIGNMLSYPGDCDSRIMYAYNVWTTAIATGGARPPIESWAMRCRTLIRRVARLQLSAESEAHGRRRPRSRLGPGGCPRVDIDRRRRTGKRCDAGSDERSLRPARARARPRSGTSRSDRSADARTGIRSSSRLIEFFRISRFQ